MTERSSMSKSLKYAIAAIIAGALTIGAGTAAAATSGAHFQSPPTGTVNNAGALVVAWDEAGLGNQNVTYSLSADASATYACINGGGNHPKAANKETKAGQVTAGGSFQARNGRVQASLTAGPLSAGAFSCPSGQQLVLACVSYSNIVLTDTTNNVTANIANVSRTFVAISGC
jgi:hypothetical protein